MFDRASIVRPLDRCRIVAGEVNRDGKRAARRAASAYTRSVHVHRAAVPSTRGSHVSMLPDHTISEFLLIEELLVRSSIGSGMRLGVEVRESRWFSGFELKVRSLSSVKEPSPVSICSGKGPSSLLGKDAESGKGIIRANWYWVHSRALSTAFKDLTSKFSIRITSCFVNRYLPRSVCFKLTFINIAASGMWSR